jgi:hypothetical protein
MDEVASSIRLAQPSIAKYRQVVPTADPPEDGALAMVSSPSSLCATGPSAAITTALFAVM